MRIDKELTYHDNEETMQSAFTLLKLSEKPAKEITNYLLDEFDGYLEDDSIDLLFWIITLCKREMELDVLEDRVFYTVCWYVPKYEDGFFDDELTEEEKSFLDRDIAYIKSKRELVEVHEVKE